MRNQVAPYGFEPIAVAPWTDRAACTEVDPDTCYPRSMCRLAEVDRAKKVCAECPVFCDCRDDVDKQENNARWNGGCHGIWAGETPAERIARRKGNIPPASPESLRLAKATREEKEREKLTVLTVTPRKRWTAQCAGECGRMLRRSSVIADEMPDTVTLYRQGMCFPCWRHAHGFKPRTSASGKPCAGCGRTMRVKSDPVEVGPALHRAHGLCDRCYREQRRNSELLREMERLAD